MQTKPTTCMADEGCDRPVSGRGLCNMHYQRARKGRIPFPLPSRIPLPRSATPEERFWIKVDKEGPIPYDMMVPYAATPCWLWTAAVDENNGYARFGKGLAHRFVWELTHQQPIPPDGETDHLCRIRNCVRPDHLELVSRGENIARQRHHGPPRKAHCHRGHCEWHVLPSGLRQCTACIRENMRAYRARLAGGQ